MPRHLNLIVSVILSFILGIFASVWLTIWDRPDIGEFTCPVITVPRIDFNSCGNIHGKIIGEADLRCQNKIIPIKINGRF